MRKNFNIDLFISKLEKMEIARQRIIDGNSYTETAKEKAKIELGLIRRMFGLINNIDLWN